MFSHHFSLVLLIFLVFSVKVSSFAEKVSLSPPEGWKRFQEEFTQVEDLALLPKATLPIGSEEPGIEILEKASYTQLSEDGTAIEVHRLVKKLLKESHLEEFSTKSFTYQPSYSKVHVASARTILPDGSRVEVKDEAIFHEGVNTESDNLFDDRKRVRIVFPDTVEGSIVEVVFVRENEVRFSNQYSRYQFWADRYPIRSRKLLVDFPADSQEKLIWDLTGDKFEPRTETGGNGLIRYSWTETGIPAFQLEAGMPDITVIGPGIRLGFDDKWGDFGEWFGNLIAEAESGEVELEKAANRWTVDSGNPEEIANALLLGVSRDIRYTGLEFGEGAFRPRDAMTVLQTKYGDCKDKANLLRVLLKIHGIESRLALLKSSLPGKLSRKIATTGIFDHAILAIDLPGRENPVFCDPTNEGVPLGFVSPRDQGKDVLMVGEDGKIEWGVIPREEPGREILNAELQIDALGGYSGWFSIKIDKAVGAYWRNVYKKYDRDERNQHAVRNFFRFVNGMRIVDSEFVPDPEYPFHYRFYAVQSSSSIKESGKTSSFALPFSSSFVTQIGREEKSREHPFLTTPIFVESRVSIRLPKNWEVFDVSPNFESSARGYEFTGEWNPSSERELAAHLVMNRNSPQFRATEFLPFSDEVRKFVQWSTSPVLVRKSAKDSERSDWSANPKNLPKMPTSEGFTTLINEHFPFDPANPYEANHRKRGIAFKRMRSLYPETDKDAQFVSRHMEAASRLFTSNGDETMAIVKEIEAIIEEYSGVVSAEKIASSEIILAAALFEVSELESAEIVADRIIATEGIPKLLKQGAAAISASICAHSDPKKGAEASRLALQNQYLSETDWGEMAAIFLYCEARNGEVSEAKERISSSVNWLKAKWPSRKEIVAESFEIATVMTGFAGDTKAATQFYPLLQDDKIFSSEADEIRSSLSDWMKSLELVTPLHAELRQFLAENPWKDLRVSVEGDRIETSVDCINLYVDDPEIGFRYVLRGLVEFGPQVDFSDRASELLDFAEEWFELNDEEEGRAPPEEIESLLNKIVELWKQAPDGDYSTAQSAYDYELSIVERRSGSKAAEQLCMTRWNDEDLPVSIRSDAVFEISKFRRKENDSLGYLKAMELYVPLEGDDFRRDEKIVEAGYFALSIGKFEHARKFFRVCTEENEAGLDNQYPDAALNKISELLADTEIAESWWDHGSVWWPAWVKLAGKIEVDDMDDPFYMADPWDEIDEKVLSRIEKLTSKKRRKNQIRKNLPQLMSHVRWHETSVEETIQFLELVKKEFPDLQAEVELLTEKMDR